MTTELINTDNIRYKERVLEYIKDNWLWYKDGDYEKELAEYEAKIDKYSDKTVALVEISYHDEALNQMISENNNITIIESND